MHHRAGGIAPYARIKANFNLILRERLEVKEQLSLAHGHTRAQLLLVKPRHSIKKHRINIGGFADFGGRPSFKRREMNLNPCGP